MKKRSSLYDTKTHTLENKDIPLGIFFAVACVSLAWYSVPKENPYLSAGLSLLVYLAVLLSSNRTRLFVPVALCLLLLLQIPGTMGLLRLVIFASLIGLTPRRRESVTPLILLLALWATYLNMAKIAGLMGRSFYEVTAFDIKLGLTEVVGFLILLMLLWSRQFTALFGRLPREVEVATVSFVLFLMATLIGSAVSFSVALHLMGIPFDTLLSNSHKDNSVITGLALTLVVIPFVLSLALNRLIRDFGRRLEQMLSANPGHGPVHLYPKIVEFNQVFSKTRELLDEHDRKGREAELNLKNTLAQKEERDREQRQITNDAENLSTIFSICPTGVMAVSGSGAILSITPAMINQFGLNTLEKYIGRYYLELQPDEEAKAEDRRKTAVFLQFVSRLINEQKTLTKSQALRSFLQIDEKTYSEMTVYVFEDRIIPVDWKRISPQLPPSDLTFVIFSNAREDHRKLILNQMFPRTIEIAGGQAIELLGEISTLATELDSRINLAADELEALQPHQVPELESQFRSTLRSTSDFGLELKGIVSEQIRKGSSPLEYRTEEERKAISNQLKTINITEEMQTLLHLFEDLFGLDAEVAFSAPEGINEHGNVVKQDVRIAAIPYQFNEFKSLFIALLSGIAKKVEDSQLALAVGSEQIGMNTAALFKGSNPGRYARIIVSHQGQSITSNMMPESLQKLPYNISSREDLGVALSVLSLRVQRMKGFLSIQSSPAKGTHITIYFPEDPLNTTSEADSLRKLPATKVERTLPPSTGSGSQQVAQQPITMPNATVGQSSASILVIEDGEKIRAELSEVLSGFPNVKVQFVSRAEAGKEFETPVSSGAGFGAAADIDKLFDDGPSVNFEDHNLVVIPIFDDLSGGMKLLKKVSQTTRAAVVTSQADYADALSALYSVLTYPFVGDEIIGILDETL